MRCVLVIVGVFALFSPRLGAAPVVVLGLTGVDEQETRVVAVPVAGGAPRHLATLAHARGHAPLGSTVVVDGCAALAASLVTETRGDALLTLVELATGAERAVLDHVLPTHTVASRDADGRQTVWAVRRLREDVRGGEFDLVEVDLRSLTSRIAATAERLWVTPARGDTASAPPSFLVIDGAQQGKADGHAHIDGVDIDDSRLRAAHALGPGLWRSPTIVAGRALLERERGGRAALIDAASKKVIAEGRPGLSPVADAQVLAVSTSTKDGAVRVFPSAASLGAGDIWRAGRAGVARPQALAHTAKGVVVVAWLDRGHALPGELWAINAEGGALLVAPPPREVITVYGVVDDVTITAVAP